MSVESIIQAICDLDTPERDRVLHLLDDLRSTEWSDQVESNRLFEKMDNPATIWHSHQEVEAMLNAAKD
jgi:hypothetical protein